MKLIHLNMLIFILICSLFAPVPLYSQNDTPVSADTLQTDIVAIDSSKSDTSVITAEKKTGVVEGLRKSAPDVEWSISLNKIFWGLVLFLTAFLIIKYFTRFLEAIAEKYSRMRMSIKRIIPIFRIIGWTTIIYLIIEGVIDPPIETIIAVTGAAGIAVGFASQDILKNIFGGIMILFDHPFQVGDKIAVGNHYGEVVNIGLRTVRIVTPDDSVVSIPNNETVNQAVSNSNSGEFNCQVVAEFFLPASVDITGLKRIAYEAAVVSKYVYLNKPVAVIIKNEVHQGRSIIKMRLKAYVLDLRYEFLFMSDMTEIVIRELIANELVKPEEFIFDV